MFCKNKDASILAYRKDKKKNIYMISSKKGVLILISQILIHLFF